MILFKDFKFRKWNIQLFAWFWVFAQASTFSAQAFQKGSFNFDLGIGVGAYSTDQTQTSGFSATISAFGFSVPFNTSFAISTTDGAASIIIPFSFEYGISDNLGLGLDFAHNDYFIDSEDKVTTESVRSFDYGLKVYYHVVNSDNFDLSIRARFWYFES